MVEPYGVLIGIRRYLVAKPKGDTNGPLRHYVAENILSAELTGESFVRDPGFDIDQYAQRAFGAFQNDAELGEVIWKFNPDVASHARAFLFHPTQVLEDQPDGSLIVRFKPRWPEAANNGARICREAASYLHEAVDVSMRAAAKSGNRRAETL